MQMKKVKKQPPKGARRDAALTIKNVLNLLDSVVRVREPRGFAILDGEVRVTRDVVEQIVKAAPRTEVELMWTMLTVVLARSAEVQAGGGR